ncbi:hypothetical protein O181_091646 [Austropuccinia psidii MF-1]|uniref:Uncharacterized protein n=1 Tax=Austropuccinia psidii MF-1 TaxID=1389203 RepID=A0A9Q3P9V4_9BASI|nr:hypothetical protein [Austropuccinia psidii MF-1]
MVRQENIQTASTVTRIIPGSTVNYDHNNTAIVPQNDQPEPIFSELINLDIGNTLQKAESLANSARKVIDVIMAEANQSQKDKVQLMTSKLINCVILELMKLFYLQKELTLPQEASVNIYKASQKPYRNELQHKEYQILAYLLKNCMNFHLTVRKFLGPPNTCTLPNGCHPFMENKNMILLTAELRKNNPPPPKQLQKTAPVASRSNSNVKKQPQAQNKGKGKAPATQPYSQGYRITKIQQDVMENIFQMARTIMELQKKSKARLKYQK